MSNGLTVSYPYQRQALAPSSMMLLAMALLLLHFLVLKLASIRPTVFEHPVVERQLRISMTPVVVTLPEMEVSEQRPAAPQPAEPTALRPLEGPAERREAEPAAVPPPVPEEKPALQEPESAAVAKPVEPDLPALVNVRVADDTAAGREKPPADARYEGATHTVAADRSKKDQIGLDPKVDGESGEIRFAGRRGENENKAAQREDPAAGSIEKEGAPEPGKPVEPQAQVAKEPEPEPAKIPEAVVPPRVEEAKPEVAAPVPPEPVVARVSAPDPQPEGVDPLKQMTPVLEPTKKIEMSEQQPLAAKSEREPQEPVDLMRQPAPRKEEPVLAEARKPATPLDPELARLQKLLEKPQAAPETALTRPGAGTREGQIGHEGDGKVRDGELNAVSDLMAATMSSASEYGDVAFSKRATPEHAYLKPYFRRMDAKWKAVFFANNRALSNLEFGTVQVRFTLSKDGQLLEVAEVSRTGTVSDTAVRACLEGLRRAAPHDAFPPSLAGREKLTETVVFLYR